MQAIAPARSWTLRRQNPFVERTLAELTAAAAAALQSDRWARSPGPLQRLDARGKVITLLLLILVTGLTRRPVVLIGLYSFAVALGLLSRLPLGLILRRVWLAVPIFVAAIALPLALTSVTPGRELPAVATPTSACRSRACCSRRRSHCASQPPSRSLSSCPGQRSGRTFSMRSALSTRRMFLSVLAMTYRYIAVTLQTAADAFHRQAQPDRWRRLEPGGAEVRRPEQWEPSWKVAGDGGGGPTPPCSRAASAAKSAASRTRPRPADTGWTLALCTLAVAVWLQGLAQCLSNKASRADTGLKSRTQRLPSLQNAPSRVAH